MCASYNPFKFLVNPVLLVLNSTWKFANYELPVAEISISVNYEFIGIIKQCLLSKN